MDFFFRCANIHLSVINGQTKSWNDVLRTIYNAGTLKRLCSTWVLLLAFIGVDASTPRPLVVGYVFGSSLLDVSKIDVTRLTHINYAFAVITDNQVVPSKANQFDAQNLQALHALKQRNPDLKILISIGGWSGSGGFSDAAYTPENRATFVASALEYMQRYQFDGIDIDWEYPGQIGAGNPFRVEDKQNFTAMLKELRMALDALSATTQIHYPLTIAAAAGASFIANTEMNIAAQYLDFVNIMTYDFTGSWSMETGHHTNLFASKMGKGSRMDSNKGVALLIAAGVPVEKLVLGVAFYGKSWILTQPDARGLNQTASSFYKELRYTAIEDTMLSDSGYRKYWDKQAKASYMYNEKTNVFVTYESPRSIKHKMRYIRKEGLRGVMFWEYFGDTQGRLLRKMR